MPKNDSTRAQDFVEIEAISNDVVRLKTGAIRKILLVSGINIELKSEEEQNLIYFEFQNFLNSLDFSIELIVHSRKLNIEEYLASLEKKASEEKDSLIKNEIIEYREFIKSFVKENDVMTKSFFVVIPYESANIPSKNTLKKTLFSFLNKKSRK